MSREHEIPIGTELRFSLHAPLPDYVVTGYLPNGDIKVKSRSGFDGEFFGNGPSTLVRLTSFGWYYKLPGPKISNRGFAKFVRRIEDV